MDEKKILGRNCLNFSEVSLLKSKIQERFYELGLKRRLVEESRVTVTKLNLEKHELINRAEKAERELSEANIHLNIAIKTGREAEAERSAARELLARQAAQLESAIKEREFLQQSNRSLQVSLDEIKHELEDTKSKMISQNHYLELIKEKDSQNKSMFGVLSSEVEQFEQNQSKLKELCSTISQITKAVSFLLDLQKLQLAEIHSEKRDLQEKVISLTGQLEEEIKEKFKTENNEKKSFGFEVWQSLQEEMKNRIRNQEDEISQLQSSLNTALATTAKLQLKDMEMSNKIRDLEEDLKKTKENFNITKVDKEVQIESSMLCPASEEESNKNIENIAV